MLPGLHVKHLLFLSDFMKFEFSRQIFEKYSNIKFHENPSNENRAFPCGRTDGQTDVTKLIVALRDFANAPKNSERATQICCAVRSFLYLFRYLPQAWQTNIDI
jgi:hypothetical protein